MQCKTGNYFGLEVRDWSLWPMGDEENWYKNLENWAKLPRGLAEVFVNDQKIASLKGLPKFGDQRWYYGAREGKPLTGDHTYVTTKANGECCHITFFRHEDKWWIFGGSKRVHVCLPLDGDRVLPNDPRTTYAREMIDFFLKKWTPSEDLMTECFSRGLTLVGEFISMDHPHIVKYDKPSLLFFAVTDADHKWCWNPSKAAEFFRKHNLEAVSIHKTPIKFVDVAGAENLEGYVSYECDADGTVIQVQKHKARQYELLRCVRECLKKNRSIEERLENFHTDISQQKPEIIAFYYWCVVNKPPETRSLYEHFCMFKDAKVERPKKTVIMLCGVPGTGKTAIGSILAFGYLRKVNAVYTDGDLFRGRSDKYHESLLRYIHDSSTEIIISGRCNHNREARKILLNAAKAAGAVVKTIVLEAGSLRSLEERIKSRKYHLSLPPSKSHVVKNFLDSWEPPTQEETRGEILTLNFHTPFEDKRKAVEEFFGTSTWSSMGRHTVWANWYGLQLFPTKEQVKIITEAIPEHLQNRHTSYHVTLAHSSEMAYHVPYSEFHEMFDQMGDEITVKVHSIMWNENIAALRVDLWERGIDPIVYCKEVHHNDEQFGHITVAKKSKDIPSVTAGSMCRDPTSSSKPLREVLEIKAKIFFQ